MTFLQMQTRVGELINQGVTTDSLTVTETEVKANLNRAYQKVVNELVGAGDKRYLRLTKANLVADQSLYGLPTDFKLLDRVEIAYVSSGVRYRATEINRDAINDPQYTFSANDPMFAKVGVNIEIFPTPSSNVTDGLWLWYYEGVTDLSDDADEANLPDFYEDLPIEYATAKAKMKLGLIDEGQVLMSEFYGEIARMKDNLAESGSDDGEMIIIREPYF